MVAKRKRLSVVLLALSVLLAVLPAGAAQAGSPMKGVTEYEFVGHLGTPPDSAGRELAWQGTISGDIVGTIEWWTCPPVPPIPTGQASHYSERVIITTSEGFLVIEDTGSTTTRHAKNSTWRTNGVVTEASEGYESWIGRRVHASGHFTWVIPGLLPAAGSGIFRLN